MRILIIILWLLIGILSWFMSNTCCDTNSNAHLSDVNEDVSSLDGQGDALSSLNAAFPVAFDSSSTDANLTSVWAGFRDSLLRNLPDNKKLGITGYYFDNEIEPGSDNLGELRARSVISLIDSLDADRIVLKGESKGPAYDAGMKGELLSFSYLEDTDKIKEIEDRTIIYFGYNSTRQVGDEEIENYLTEVAQRVVGSGERVRLVGHTDNRGSIETNEYLGEQRALVIENFLVKQGVNPSKIDVISRGERSPIATNDTATGRAKNRRVELQIIK